MEKGEKEKRQEEQVDLNFKVFQEKLPNLLKTHKGKFALMRDGEIVSFHNTNEAAYNEGIAKYYKDKIFSIQEVDDSSIDLGFFSHAMPVN